jgi:ATP-dependent exoDNAse (exonuclease V) beta subunit
MGDSPKHTVEHMTQLTSVLDNDKLIALPAVTVVAASAGSGKTHTLTRRYVQFLLSENIPNNGLRNMLAITFTNNAAKEMKQRVLELLQKLCIGDQEEMERMAELVSIDKHILKDKASRLVDKILENYSDFQVRTIDSFMTMIFKTSALEFGFHPDFEILLTSDLLIDEAFDIVSKDIISDAAQTKQLERLVDLISLHTENYEYFLWDPYAKIGREVKMLHRLLGSRPDQFVSEDFSKELGDAREQLKAQARLLRNTIQRSDLRIQQRFQNDLEAADEGDIDTLIDRKLKDDAVVAPRIHEESKYGKWKGEISEQHHKFNVLIRVCTALISRSFYHPYGEALKLLSTSLWNLKRQRGSIFIDDVNKILREKLPDLAVPDIYFKLGETINHYLIDEFQDTSPIQWENLKLLIENVVSQERGSLFVVGDTKQSIFTFRGADWTILKNMIKSNPFPSASYAVKELNTNWRSYEEIVEFSREIFQNIDPASGYAEAAQLSGLTDSAQNLREGHEGKGYVEVCLLHKDEAMPSEKEKILEVIADCMSRGYSYRDIAFLTPRNDDVIKVSAWLNDNNVLFISYSSLDVRSRKITGEIIALLQFLDSPIDDNAFAAFVLGDIFNETCRVSGAGVTPEDLRGLIFSLRTKTPPQLRLYKAFQQSYPELWSQYFEELYGLVGYLPLYDLLSEAYKIFDVFERCKTDETSLAKLLEVVKTFEDKGNNSIKDFLELAFLEGDISVWEMDVPADDDAVKLMTIHKAKGLDFPVVIALVEDGPTRWNRYHVEETENGIRLLRITKKLVEKDDGLRALYESHRLKDRVDRLNQLYVALTRAKYEMYVIGLYKDKPGEPTKLFPGTSYTRGRKSPNPGALQVMKPSFPASHHTARMRYEPREYGKIALVETQRGNAIHAVLADIEFLDGQVESVVEKALQMRVAEVGGLLNRQETKAELTTFLKRSAIRKYFDNKPGRKVFREQEFSSRDGVLYRLDRVVEDTDAVTVIDYKTGGKDYEDEYRIQVKAYMETLRDVFPEKKLYGVLAYVDLMVLEEVT